MEKQSLIKNQCQFIRGYAGKFWMFFLILSLLAVPVMGWADEEDDVYDSMFGSVGSLYSTGYGIVFDELKEDPNTGATQRLAPYIDKINKIVGFAATAGSASRKAGAGDIIGAGEETVLTILAEVAGWDSSGKAVLKYLGLSTGVFQLALTAYSITKESYAQVEATKIARDIESLYGAIESDPVLKPRTGRQIGDKSDPIPVTKESVEYVFRKVVQDQNWRQRLNSYVTGELGRTFPEPSFWDVLIVGGVGGGGAVDRAEQAEVFKNRQEIETWIAGLLSQLNKYARAAESEVFMRKALLEIAKASKKITPEFQKFVVNAEDAVKKLPEIEAYAKQAPQAIANANKNQKWDDLYDIRDRIGYFVRVYVRILPDTGVTGQRKNAVKAAFKQSWSSVAKALKDMPKTIQTAFVATTAKYPSTLAFSATSIGLISIDAVETQLRQAKSLQDMEVQAKNMTQDAAKTWGKFSEQFNKENPPGDNHPSYNSQREAIMQSLSSQSNALQGALEACGGYTQARDRDPKWHKCINSATAAMRALTVQPELTALESQKKNYDEKRRLYVENAKLQYDATGKAIGKFASEERARYVDMDNLKKAALDNLASFNQRVPTFFPVNETKNYQVTASDTKQYLNSLRNVAPDGYLGLPKMTFPKWGENGQAVVYYIEDLRKKISNENSRASGTNERYKRALEYIGSLKRYLVERDRYAQELTEVTGQINALKLQSDPKAQVIPNIEKRILDMKDVEKVALEVETEVNKKFIDDSQKLLVSIQEDLLYLGSLLKKVEYWTTVIQGNRLGGAVNVSIVRVAIATEGSSGANQRNFLAPSSSDLTLFDKAKTNAAADALLQDIERTGIAKWDPKGDTGLKTILEAKAAEIRTYFIDSPDYAVVNGNVVYATRIAKMAADVSAIPVSSYGSQTYKEGIKNRTFDEKLGAALRNGTAFAMEISMKTAINTVDARIDVTLDTARNLAANHKNAAIKGAAGDVVKAINDHLTRYNAQVAQEAKQFTIDRAKAEEERKLQDECLTKGGQFANGKCITTPIGTGPGQTGRPGQSGQPTGPGQSGQPTGPGVPVQQAGKGSATPPAGTGTMTPPIGQGTAIPPQGQGQPAGAGQTMAQGAAQPAAVSSGIPQAPSPQSGASGIPQTSPSVPTGQSAAPQGQKDVAALSGTAKTTPPQSLGTMPSQPSPSSQDIAPAKTQMPFAGSGTVMEQPKAGSIGSMPQQSKPGQTASLQGAAGIPKTEDLTPKVKELYNQFRQAYESKNTSGVMRCLSSQWTSSDGGTTSDLQRNLQKTFTMFDEVKFNIQNLQVNKVTEGKYRTSYDVTITSKIYKKNLKHEEKSSISEEVTIESGQPKISKTLGGKIVSVK
ncbi:MAG: hypothetical protein C0399_05580 [Syntrophus sp. (in: bacteria)]|nr:hypothetical protein [Syntrophus sp. (in: bacteria)]